jgi:hypothetical protein
VGDGVLDKKGCKSSYWVAHECSGIGELDGEKLGSELSLVNPYSSLSFFSSLLISADNNSFNQRSARFLLR